MSSPWVDLVEKRLADLENRPVVEEYPAVIRKDVERVDAALRRASSGVFHVELGTVSFADPITQAQATALYDALGAATAAAALAALAAKVVTESMWSVLGNLVAATTYYAGPGSASLPVVEYKFPVTRACVVQRLFARVTTAPGGTDTLTVTVNKNGLAQAITVTFTGAAVSANDQSHSFACVAGDELSVSAVTSALAVPVNLTLTFEILSS